MTAPAPSSTAAPPAPLMRVAGVLWLLAGICYLACETIVAAAFPGYSYARSYISDLGAPFGTVVDGRVIHSPLAPLMNIGGLMADGSLFVAASVVVASATGAVRTRAGLALVVLGIMHGIGTILVGAVPEGGAGSGAIPPLHVIGAGLSIGAGNAGLLLLGAAGARLGAARAYRIASAVLGALGLSALALLETNRFGGMALAPDGLLERASVYPITAWEVMTGMAILIACRVRRA